MTGTDQPIPTLASTEGTDDVLHDLYVARRTDDHYRAKLRANFWLNYCTGIWGVATNDHVALAADAALLDRLAVLRNQRNLLIAAAGGSLSEQDCYEWADDDFLAVFYRPVDAPCVCFDCRAATEVHPLF